MNQKSSDPGAADPDTDTNFHEEHSSELIVAVCTVQQSQLQFSRTERVAVCSVVSLQDFREPLINS